MKTLKLIIINMAIAISLNAQVANIMKFPAVRYDGGKYVDTMSFDIDTIIDRAFINQRLADSIVSWWPESMIQNSSIDFRILPYEFGVRWGAGDVTNMLKGEYDQYTGIDTMRVAMFELTLGSYYVYRKYQYEFVLRLSNRLDGSMGSKVGKLCFAKFKNAGGFTYGYLQPEYSATNNTAYLIKDTSSGEYSAVVDYNTVSLYTSKLAEHFNKVK